MNRYQVGVLPVTSLGDIVIVTSRSSGDWILPKGKPEKNRHDAEVAEDEAFEEAGVFGDLIGDSVEFEVSLKNADRMKIFWMEVREILESYPEVGERRRAVVSLEAAMKMLNKDFRAILEALM